MFNAKATSAHRALGQSLQSTTVAANDHCSKGEKGEVGGGGGVAIQCIFLPGAHFSQLHLKWHKEGFEFHTAMIWTGAEPGYHPPNDCKNPEPLEQNPAFHLPPQPPPPLPLLARAVAFRGGKKKSRRGGVSW